MDLLRGKAGSVREGNHGWEDLPIELQGWCRQVVRMGGRSAVFSCHTQRQFGMISSSKYGTRTRQLLMCSLATRWLNCHSNGPQLRAYCNLLSLILHLERRPPRESSLSMRLGDGDAQNPDPRLLVHFSRLAVKHLPETEFGASILGFKQDPAEVCCEAVLAQSSYKDGAGSTQNGTKPCSFRSRSALSW